MSLSALILFFIHFDPWTFLKEDIRTTVLEGETDWDPNIVTLYDIFTKGLKIARKFSL